MQGFANPTGSLVLGQSNRLAIKESSRVGGCKIASGHSNAAEVFAGGAKGVHVALCKHADPSCWRVKAVGHVPTVVDVLKKR